MNTILRKIISASNGSYCHVLEVHSIYEIQSAIEAITDEFKVGQPNQLASVQQLKEFFNTIELYSLNKESEDEIYSFNTSKYIDSMSL